MRRLLKSLGVIVLWLAGAWAMLTRVAGLIEGGTFGDSQTPARPVGALFVLFGLGLLLRRGTAAQGENLKFATSARGACFVVTTPRSYEPPTSPANQSSHNPHRERDHADNPSPGIAIRTSGGRERS
jgi:hypothetical protein